MIDSDHKAKSPLPGDALARALREIGVVVEVEPRDRLAVLVPMSGIDVASLADDGVRRQAVALAKREGFTHVALEIRPVRAPISRD